MPTNLLAAFFVAHGETERKKMKLGNKVAKLSAGTMARQTHRSVDVEPVVEPVVEPKAKPKGKNATSKKSKHS